MHISTIGKIFTITFKLKNKSDCESDEVCDIKVRIKLLNNKTNKFKNKIN